MESPYASQIEVDGQLYFSEPYSLDPLPDVLRHGLIPVGILATLSVAFTAILIAFIVSRLITWKLHYNTFPGYNQYVMLVVNLLIADLQQSSAFLVSFYWIHYNRILAPSSPCFAQAWLLHSGDVSSGFFVLAIALHTFWTAICEKRVTHKAFTFVIVLIWTFAYFLTSLGLMLHGNRYFVRAGAWCWVSEAYQDERLALHYIWIFLVQGGTVLIYITTFFALRRKAEAVEAEQGRDLSTMKTTQAVKRITGLMTLYPCVYVILTLPLSVGRMWSLAHGGHPYSEAYACVAGAMITSCGWVDTLLYTLTRKRLLHDTMPQRSWRGRTESDPGGVGNDYITPRIGSVSVESRLVMNTLAVPERGDDAGVQHRDYGRDLSSRGSEASILNHSSWD